MRRTARKPGLKASGASRAPLLRVWMCAALLLALAVCLAARRDTVRAQILQSPITPSSVSLQDPDAVCAQCHAAITARFRRSAMGAGSGLALPGLLPGAFTHTASGVRYRVFARDGKAWMQFQRQASNTEPALDGERELLLFVGSGRRGRTYLYRQGSAWFELPVNWYTRQARWAMAPAYDNAARMPSPLPVDAGCLHCHAGGVERALAEGPNVFAGQPFHQGGIGCSACHGDPAEHLRTQGHGPIVNPAKMSVAARDSACIQCHLEGDAMVNRAGRMLAEFKPGDRLFDFAVYFVRASQRDGGQRASSQYEALLRSACKRATGDALTCTTCHDPHGEPPAAERVVFYRAACLRCHTAPAMQTHHAEQPDCATCHMPSRRTADISHEQVTDHDIEAVAATKRTAVRKEGETLVPVGEALVGPRELGLAYAQRAEQGDAAAAERALPLLQQARSAGAEDVALEVNLGFLEQRNGDVAAARREYAAALRQDPYSAAALSNRAVLDLQQGDVAEAVRLLDRLLRADPTRTTAGMTLWELECRAGETGRAAALLETLRTANPDAPALQGVKVCR